MTFSKYMSTPLDESYSQTPGELIEEGAIPEEEIEVRRCLVTGSEGQWNENVR